MLYSHSSTRPSQHIAEMNRPDAVVGFLESYGVLLECVGNEQQPLSAALPPPAAAERQCSAAL